VYLFYIPVAAKADFYVEAAPSVEADYKKLTNETGQRVDAQGVAWGPHKPAGPYPGRRAGQSMAYSAYSTNSSPSSPSGASVPLRSFGQASSDEGPAPSRPPPPKSRPNVKKWKKEWDPTYQTYYYVNIKTNASQWDLPEDFAE